MNGNRDTRRVLQVDAFTTEPLAGNAAGVVPDGDGLTDEQMQAIAREVAVSETAFLRSSDAADRRVRYFTPSQEVDLCGHATIGSFAHLHEAGALEPDDTSADGAPDGDGAISTTLETNVGVLEVTVEPDGTVWMTQGEPTIREVDVGYDRIADALGVGRDALEGVGADLPLAVASTGLPFLIVPIAYLSDVGGAEPDTAAVEALSGAVDAAGVYLFTFDALEAESTLHGRMFAPAAGVPEDPVTGTASGATGAYLERFGAFDDLPEEMRFEQGHYVDRPGYVRVRVGDGVRVGGRGVTAVDGTIAVPEGGDDDILEV